MTTYFTSDTHFGHERIISLCDRPFTNVENMNENIVHNWNALVRPDDTVYHLGDVALGPIQDSLAIIQRLNGRKIMITGNHDRPFPPMQRGREAKIAEWTQKYLDAGFEEIYSNHRLVIGDYHFNLSHFPYDGDNHEEERFSEFRLADSGVPLIHGHTHFNSRFSLSKAGTAQIHVGQDAWDFAPVSLQAVIDLLDKES